MIIILYSTDTKNSTRKLPTADKYLQQKSSLQTCAQKSVAFLYIGDKWTER